MPEPKTVAVTMILKDGGYKLCQITPKMLGQLAVAIKEKGHETVHLVSGPIEVSGVLVRGRNMAPGIIVLGQSEGEA